MWIPFWLTYPTGKVEIISKDVVYTYIYLIMERDVCKSRYIANYTHIYYRILGRLNLFKII